MEALLADVKSASKHGNIGSSLPLSVQLGGNVLEMVETMEDAYIEELGNLTEKSKQRLSYSRNSLKNKTNTRQLLLNNESTDQNDTARLKTTMQTNSSSLNNQGRVRLRDSFVAINEGHMQVKNALSESIAKEKAVEARLEDVGQKLLKKIAARKKLVADADERRKSETKSSVRPSENVYLDARREALEVNRREQIQLQNDSIERRKMSICDKVLKEEYDVRREEVNDKERAQNAPKVIIDDFLDSKYLVSSTTDHVDCLDPSSRAIRIYPSEVTDFADKTIGTGVRTRVTSDHMSSIIHRELRKLKRKKLKRNTLLETLKGSVADCDLTMNKFDESFQKCETEFNRLVPKKFLGTNEIEFKELPYESSHKMSKMENDIQTRAFDSQREKLLVGTVQKVCGRTFDKAGFSSVPQVVKFVDFSMNQEYEVSISLTNVSYSFNSFRLQSIPEDIKDIIIVEFIPPGRVPSGISNDVIVKFRPFRNQDTFSEIRFMSETGPFSVPIECRSKKCLPSLSTDTLKFDQTILGESTFAEFDLINQGVIDCHFSIMIEGGENIVGNCDAVSIPDVDGLSERLKSDMSNPVSCRLRSRGHKNDLWIENETSGSLNGYCRKHIRLHWNPLSLLGLTSKLTVTFSSNDLDEMKSIMNEEYAINVTGTVLVTPLTFESPTTDLKCCVFDRLYRSSVYVKNLSTASQKATIRMESTNATVKSCFSFSPSVSFVQPSSNQEIRLKFEPTRQLADEIAEYYSSQSEAFMIAVRVDIAGLLLPIFFVLKLQLSGDQVVLAISEPDFGICYVGSSVVQEFSITNSALVPQMAQVIFPKNSPFCHAAGINDRNSLLLLPAEKKIVGICFSPEYEGRFESTVTVKTSLNYSTSLPLVAQGERCPVQFSHPVINLSPVCCGGSIQEYTVIKNMESDPIEVQFAAPEKEFGVDIDPMVIKMAPEAEACVRISYDCPLNWFETCKNQEKLLPESIGSMDTRINQETGEEFCSIGWKIACFVKNRHSVPPMYLTLRTTALSEIVIPTPRMLDFGRLFVGQREILTISLQNLGFMKTSVLIKQAPSASGNFWLLNSSRPLIAENGTHKLLVECNPTISGLFFDSITLFFPVYGKSLSIGMRCEVLSPALRINPASGVLDLGCLSVGAETQTAFNLYNESAFPLSFRIETGKSFPICSNGLPAYFMTPSKQCLEPSSEISVQIVSCPQVDSSSSVVVESAIFLQGEVKPCIHVRTSARYSSRQIIAYLANEIGQGSGRQQLFQLDLISHQSAQICLTSIIASPVLSCIKRESDNGRYETRIIRGGELIDIVNGQGQLNQKIPQAYVEFKLKPSSRSSVAEFESMQMKKHAKAIIEIEIISGWYPENESSLEKLQVEIDLDCYIF